MTNSKVYLMGDEFSPQNFKYRIENDSLERLVGGNGPICRKLFPAGFGRETEISWLSLGFGVCLSYIKDYGDC